MAVATVTAVATPDRKIRCRYMDYRTHRRRPTAVLEQCTAEAVAADGEALLCPRHLGDALALLRRYGVTPEDTP